MIDRVEIKKYLKHEMEKRHYRAKSIQSYTHWNMQLFAFFPNIQPEQITIEHIQEYINVLEKRKKVAPFTIHVAINAFELFFNELLGRNLPVRSVDRPSRKRDIPEIMSEHEVKKIINAVPMPQSKLIIMLLYSTGMELSEATNLRPVDIDLKNKAIHINLGRQRNTRTALIADALLEPLSSQLENKATKEWLFPGRKTGQHCGGSSIQKAFKTAVKKTGIRKKFTVKSLRYAYVVHLHKKGVSLNKILGELEISTPQSIYFYHQLEENSDRVQISPIDFIAQKSPTDIALEPLIETLSLIKQQDIKDYILESISCLQVGANRAATIFTWTAAIRIIQSLCLLHSPHTLNDAVRKFIPKSRKVKEIEDFAVIRDRTCLDIARQLRVFDKNEHGVLVECLNLRNRCGHPGKYTPGVGRVTGFIEDIITIVFKRACSISVP